MAQRGRPRRRKHLVSRRGDTPGGSRVSSAGQRLPALRAGCLVRAGSQDAAGAVPTPTASGRAGDRFGTRTAWELRSPGFHAFLGSFAAGLLGGEAEDGPGPLEPRTQDDYALVSAQPAPTDPGATPNAEPETPWPLRLLWNHGQQLCVVAVPGGGGPHLEVLVVAPPTVRLLLLGGFRPVAAALSAAAGPGRPLGVPSCR